LQHKQALPTDRGRPVGPGIDNRKPPKRPEFDPGS